MGILSRSINTEEALKGVSPAQVSCPKKESSEMVLEFIARLREVFAGLLEHSLIVDLDLSNDTSVFLACCHQSHEVWT